MGGGWLDCETDPELIRLAIDATVADEVASPLAASAWRAAVLPLETGKVACVVGSERKFFGARSSG